MKGAVVTPASQVEKLKIRMSEKGITHAGELRVDIPGIRIGEPAYPEGATAFGRISGRFQKGSTVYFCNISELHIRKILRDGDGGPIPDEAVVYGLNVETPGRYDLINARMYSNGQITVVVDEETRLAPAAE